MSSLREIVDSLNKPAPELPDVEDSVNTEDIWTRQRPLEDEGSLAEPATIRRIRGAVLDDDDVGEKVSVKDVFSGEGISGLSLRRPRRSDSYSEDASEGSLRESENEFNGSDREESEVSVSVDSNEEKKQDIEDVDQESDVEVEEKIQPMILKEGVISENRDDQIYKGKCIQRQLNIWDKLIHMQIKTHAALQAYNRLPRGEVMKKFMKNADEETLANYKQIRKSMHKYLDTLLLIEESLLSSSKQTASIVNATSSKDGIDSDDEEIQSSDDEKVDEDVAESQYINRLEDEEDDEDDIFDSEHKSNMKEKIASGKKLKKRRTLDELNDELANREARFCKFRKQTLAKWDERTHLTNPTKTAKKNFTAFESSILNQIDQVMADKRRLIRKTQTKRSDIDRIGANPEALHDPEIYDDDDFYQQILRELIERKTTNTTDPVEMSRQWIEIQQLRNRRSKKKKVDTKASKGRKIRYVVMPKLVNYFPSMPETVKWSHEMRNHLFQSLFVSAS